MMQVASTSTSQRESRNEILLVRLLGLGNQSETVKSRAQSNDQDFMQVAELKECIVERLRQAVSVWLNEVQNNYGFGADLAVTITALTFFKIVPENQGRQLISVS